METPSKTVKKKEKNAFYYRFHMSNGLQFYHRGKSSFSKCQNFALHLGPPPLSVFCHFEIRLCCTFEKNLRIASPKLCTSASKLFTSSVQQKFSRRFHIDIFEITVDFKSQIGKRTKEAVKQKVAKIATNARK